jgi:5-methylcytosine-specific restriction endonuclease McrA
MNKFLNVKFTTKGSFKEHVFGKTNVGNCVLCGEFLAMDRHHIVTQSKGGGKEDEVNVCRKCHAWVHNHPFEASKRGLYINKYKV